MKVLGLLEVWEEMTKNWLLLHFLVRSKNYTFLETLEQYKTIEHSVYFFFFQIFCGFLGPEYYEVS